MTPAKAGDRVVLVSCCRGRVYVAASYRDDWRCRCGARGVGNVVLVLPPAGEPVPQ